VRDVDVPVFLPTLLYYDGRSSLPYEECRAYRDRRSGVSRQRSACLTPFVGQSTHSSGICAAHQKYAEYQLVLSN
jgi:hypothetical protein